MIVKLLRWSKEKEEYLIKNWKKYDDIYLGNQLGCTEQAVEAKRRRLKLFRVKKKIRNTKKYTYDEVKLLFEERGYELISTEYTGYRELLYYTCKKHKEYGSQHISFSDFLRGRGCICCGYERTANAKKHPDSYYIEECEKRNFTFVKQESIDRKTYIHFICNKHPQYGIQKKLLCGFQKTLGCVHCNPSKTETLLEDILDRNNITYITQKRFKGCKDKYTLPFDFYLPDYNILIEYDGEFHYMPIRKGKMTDEEAIKQLETQQRRDKIKTEYCNDNNIPLIRIPYWEKDNMECFLFEKMKGIINI